MESVQGVCVFARRLQSRPAASAWRFKLAASLARPAPQLQLQLQLHSHSPRGSQSISSPALWPPSDCGRRALHARPGHWRRARLADENNNKMSPLLARAPSSQRSQGISPKQAIELDNTLRVECFHYTSLALLPLHLPSRARSAQHTGGHVPLPVCQ